MKNYFHKVRPPTELIPGENCSTVMDNNVGSNPPLADENLHMRLAAHEKAIAALKAERAQLIKQLDSLKAERQVLEAVARKVATTRRQSMDA